MRRDQPRPPKRNAIGQQTAVTPTQISGLESAGALSPSSILAKLLTVDGAGSGLDADLLDGQSGAFYLARANHTGTQLAATISDFSEAVDDRAAALLVAGTNISLSYNDGAGTLTIAAAGLDETAQDAVGGILTDTATIDFTYNDGAPSITADVIDGSITNAKAADMAQATIKGRADAAGTGDPTDLSAAQVLTILGGTTGTGALVRANDPTFTDDIFVTVNAIAGAMIATDNVSNFLTGTTNVEISASLGRVMSINRNGAVRRDLLLDGLSVLLQSTGVTKLTVANSAATFAVAAILATFTIATLPASNDGALAFASNGRKTGEGAGAGTGIPVYRDGGNWYRFADDSVAAA